jgi:hypothetical protein
MARRPISPALTHPLSLAPQGLLLDQGSDDLLDEEGVALRLIEDPRADAGRQVGQLQEVLDEALGLVRQERGQGELGQPVRVVSLRVEPKVPEPALRVGPGRDQDHEGQKVGELGERGEDLDGGGVGPVQILDGQDERLARGQPLDDGAQREHELRLERAWIHRCGRPSRFVLDPEEVGDGGMRPVEFLPDERTQRHAELGPRHRRGLRPRELEDRPQDLNDRRVARVLGKGLATPLDPAHARGRVAAKLVLEARLPDPRLAADGHDLAAPLGELGRAAMKSGQLGLSAHEGRREPWNSTRGGGVAKPVDDLSGDRRGESLEGEWGGGLRLDEGTNEPERLRAEDDAARGGLEPRGEIGDLSRDHELAARAGDGDGLAGGDPDA